MNRVYLNSACVISPQDTLSTDGFLEPVISYTDTVVHALDANYKEFISPGAARRMAKGIKMGVVAAKTALSDAVNPELDGIITGTGLGCVIDSEKFVQAIIDNDEQYLTPTPFIQSTHNTVGGQVALELGCKAYNFTYVHGSVSFEMALLDALMQLRSGEGTNFLVGGIDELGAHTIEIHRRIKHIKEQPIDTSKIIGSDTEGTVFGEGANFFVISAEQKQDSWAELVGLQTFNTIAPDNLETLTESFLRDHNLSADDVDAVVLGCNGDVEFDTLYNPLKTQFSESLQLGYKHLCGEYYTASAFGTWLAAKILKEQQIPDCVRMNSVQKDSIETVLLYNQYRGENHSLMLLKRC